MSLTYINDVWSLYFHDPYDMNWEPNSYKFITTISSVEDYINVYKAFEDLWTRGMFFIMREHIQPLWEDKHNKNGGCLSFKVNKPEVATFWFLLNGHLLGGTLGKNQNISDEICGISISPKRNYCIVRIWISSNKYANILNYNIAIPTYTQVIYKNHEENNDFENKNK